MLYILHSVPLPTPPAPSLRLCGRVLVNTCIILIVGNMKVVRTKVFVLHCDRQPVILSLESGGSRSSGG